MMRGIVTSGTAMKAFMLIALIMTAVAAHAADGSELVHALREQTSHVRLANMKMNNQERVADAHIDMYGPSATPLPTGDNVAAAIKDARTNGIAAYKAWVSGKSQDDQAAAKKLLAAFLVYIQDMQVCGPCGPAEQMAGAQADTAYDKAESEFQVETGTF